MITRTGLLLAGLLAVVSGCQQAAPPATSAPIDVEASQAPGFTRLFDGRTFDGWDGDTQKTWRIEDGAFVGGSLNDEVPHNEFLATTREFSNFVLRLQFRLRGTEGFVNAGVQVRSQRVPDHYEMVGYQLDLGDPAWWGSLYDESRRNKVLAQSDMDTVDTVLRRGEWNDYEIRCEGPRVRAFINGAQTIDYTELDATLSQTGRIGLQIHGGGKAEVWYRNIEIQVLP